LPLARIRASKFRTDDLGCVKRALIATVATHSHEREAMRMS
jgi:hypothetical protein